MDCIVCESNSTKSFGLEDKEYWKCKECFAIFLAKRNRLSPEDERSRYEQHNNKTYDKKYRNFLSKLYGPMVESIDIGSRGLDYGCGPGPALAEMFKEDGFDMDIYDPFFFPEEKIFSKSYDFISCTETIEHFFEPAREFKILNNMLLKGGVLGVMTAFLEPEQDFDLWYYRKDPTHVVFYHRNTFRSIASKMGWSYTFPDKGVVLFKK